MPSLLGLARVAVLRRVPLLGALDEDQRFVIVAAKAPFAGLRPSKEETARSACREDQTFAASHALRRPRSVAEPRVISHLPRRIQWQSRRQARDWARATLWRSSDGATWATCIPRDTRLDRNVPLKILVGPLRDRPGAARALWARSEDARDAQPPERRADLRHPDLPAEAGDHETELGRAVHLLRDAESATSVVPGA